MTPEGRGTKKLLSVLALALATTLLSCTTRKEQEERDVAPGRFKSARCQLIDVKGTPCVVCVSAYSPDALAVSCGWGATP